MTDTAGPQFVLSGNRNDTSPGYQGTDGGYWSSAAYTSAILAYSLNLSGTNSAVYPVLRYGKYLGFTLRCLA